MGKRGFKELLVWQRSKALAVTIYNLSGTGKLSHDFGLRDQMRRAAVSVCSNIAEGDERSSGDKEAVRFFHIAKGSLAELITQLEIAHEIGHIETCAMHDLEQETTTIAKMLGALIRARSGR